MGIGKPGNWHEVEDRYKKIADADPGAIRTAESTLTTAATSSDEHSADLKRFAGELREAWPKGQDGETFAAHIDKMSTAGAKVNGKLEKAAEALKGLADTLETTKTAVKQLHDTAEQQIDANCRKANAYDGLLAEEFQSRMNKVNEAIASAAAEDIQKKLDEADTAITQAAKAFDGGIDGGYTGLKAPSGHDGDTTQIGRAHV